MTVSSDIQQTPAPGTRSAVFCGDTISFHLSVPRDSTGSAWVRTNLGRVDTVRMETIAEVEAGRTPLGRDWFDIPMHPRDNGLFSVRLGLHQVGHFEAKCFFLPHGADEPMWPPGENAAINVSSADACCANTIYNAFVRQFGPNRSGGFFDEACETHSRRLDQRGFTVIPPSGTFRDLIRELDFVVGTLRCRIIQLLPVNPTPTTYGRMGRFGSPYASLAFTAVDPSLAEFDPRTTPLEQFSELVDAVHVRGAKLFLDMAVNHTGWAAGIHESHPEWLVRDDRGTIETPGAWGVVWADLTRLDYRKKKLWVYMADVFLQWCRRGVDGFRCDAGYMIPRDAWRYIIARVRTEFPDTIFFLEGLGGKISVTRQLLNEANFDWAYSELFQNYQRSEIERYLPEPIDVSEKEGLMVHFAETHDNNRLAQRSSRYARMRTALCALTSPCGAWGFANGVEWLATEKIDVHGSPSLNWGAPDNQVDEICRLNQLIIHHPAFHDHTQCRMIQTGTDNSLALLRHHQTTGAQVLVLANLDADAPQRVSWHAADFAAANRSWVDLLTDRRVEAVNNDDIVEMALDPGAVLCLSTVPFSLPEEEKNREAIPDGSVPRILYQQLCALVLRIHQETTGGIDVTNFDLETAVAQLRNDPRDYLCGASEIPGGGFVLWRWPGDQRREAMVPTGHFLLIESDKPIRARVEGGGRVWGAATGFACKCGGYYAVVPPVKSGTDVSRYRLCITVFDARNARHEAIPIHFLSAPRELSASVRYSRKELFSDKRLFLSTNGCGGMVRARLRWGTLESRYDALLAGNPNPRWPENRWIMFARCRAWLVYQGYSQELDINCLAYFHQSPNGTGTWRFQVPTGHGESVGLQISVAMVTGYNAVLLQFFRENSPGDDGYLSDDHHIRLIIRPDLENRDFHDVTKAYMGPENTWPQCVKPRRNGFCFKPGDNRILDVHVEKGTYISQPEWKYMVYRSIDAERGMDPNSDLFSPGYFEVAMTGGETVTLSAAMQEELLETDAAEQTHRSEPIERHEHGGTRPLAAVLERALDAYIVRRGEGRSIIAGYPWFLDWGRDSMIFVRSLIQLGRLTEAASILGQFGRYEDGGTIPNMIAGGRAANRDTSDGPLWFLKACSELLAAAGETAIDRHFGRRTLRDIALSIGRSYIRGTRNGIYVDTDTGLVFSPSHFTWMDTNHPAGSPREGYPIEIQALWHAALEFLSQLDSGNDRWRQLAEQMQSAFIRLFIRPETPWLIDCLHATPGTSALAAEPDNALRPNQLFAITLGFVSDSKIRRQVLVATTELLVPGGMRSLADRPVTRPIEILHRGNRLGDHYRPYRGVYTGDEDTSRKPAYHNGTAWTWLLPVFCEAWADTYGEAGKPAALAWLSSLVPLLEGGCTGHLPEILDGDRPHRQRGCEAQAWSVSEALRVHRKLVGPA